MLAYTLLPIGKFLRGLKVDGCLLSLQSTILLCIYVTKFPRAPVGPRWAPVHTSSCQENCPPSYKHTLPVKYLGVLQIPNSPVPTQHMAKLMLR